MPGFEAVLAIAEGNLGKVKAGELYRRYAVEVPGKITYEGKNGSIYLSD